MESVVIRMISITKEELDIEETLKKKIKNTLSFLGIKASVKKGNIISISKTNLAYIEPHKLTIDNTTYLFFNDSDYVFINTLENKIRFSNLNDYIKSHKN